MRRIQLLVLLSGLLLTGMFAVAQSSQYSGTVLADDDGGALRVRPAGRGLDPAGVASQVADGGIELRQRNFQDRLHRRPGG